MDATLAQILAELFRAHQTIDALRDELDRLQAATTPPEPGKGDT